MQKHQARIYAICRRLAGNDADALDATQEALIAIVKGLERFDGRAAFTTWSYRVATNACLDELRRRSRRPQPGLPDHEDIADEALGRRPSLDPGEAVTARIDVDDALAQLPEEFKAPVVLEISPGSTTPRSPRCSTSHPEQCGVASLVGAVGLPTSWPGTTAP